MAEADIPVDLFNPGQVFACLGFLEAADILLGEAEGGFDWSREAEDGVKFRLRATADQNPVAAVLEFLAQAEVKAIAPAEVEGPWPEDAESTKAFPAPLKALRKSDGKALTGRALPIYLKRGNDVVPITHWLERDRRFTLKLFAGQQVGARLAANMLCGDPTKTGSKGLKDIYPNLEASKFDDPFKMTCVVGGRFGFDARGGWDAIRIGTSLDEQGVLLELAPHLELLAAIGLEHTRPKALSTYQIRYAAWAGVLPLALCRVALFAPDAFLPKDEYRSFRTHLGDDKQYKKIFFAEEEPDQ